MSIGRVARSLSVPLAVALVLLLLAGIIPSPVRAANFAVTVTMSDENSGGNSDIDHFLPGCSMSGTPPCSLRDAVIFANRQATTDTTTITLPAGTYTLRITGRVEDQAVTGDLDILRNVVINGAGAGTTVVQASATGSATGIDRVFEVGATGTPTATISGMTIRFGNATGSDNGGGIAVTTSGSSLTLNDCVISDNAVNGIGGGLYVASGTTLVANRTTVRNNTSGFRGGGIANSGTLTVTNSTFSANNTSGVFGGGIDNNGGTLTVTNSTFAANTVNSTNGGGGGIVNPSGGTLTVTNSTFFANTANGPGGVGGGIGNGGTLTLTNSTFFANTANGMNGTGGGIYNVGTLAAINTLIAGNTASGSGGTGPDVGGAYAPGSKNNLLGNGSGATNITDNDANHNIVGHPALLDTILRDNGTTNGTQTLALLTGSPAINNGDLATCANTTGTAPVAGKDQRGIARPQPSSGQCDIGAFEYVFPATATALTAGPNPSTFGQSVTFTATVTGGVGTPTGSVTFKDGATVIGGGTLFSGVATFSTSGLSGGSHPITAVYSGDATSPPSTSAGLTQVVTVPVQSIAVTATSMTVAVGATDQFTATCTYTDSTTAPCTNSVSWSSDTLTVATVNPAGLVTGVSAGSAKITASVGGVTGSANVTVTRNGAPPVACSSTRSPSRYGCSIPVLALPPSSPPMLPSLPVRRSPCLVSSPLRGSPSPLPPAIVGNATVANGSNGTPAGFATIFPSGVPLPLTSNLNFVPGTVRPNDFTVAFGSDGKFNLYSSSGGDFVIDISGYYAPVGAGGLYFHPLEAPVRELDTRGGSTAFVHPERAP